jgi:predicted esterase
MAMKKLFFLTPIILFILVLDACAKTTPILVEGIIKSGAEINGMRFSPMDPLQWDYSLAFLCNTEPVEQTDISHTLKCSTFPGGRVFFGNCSGILYETKQEADEKWRDLKLEITFDDLQVDLPSFGYIDTGFPEDTTKTLRIWNLMVENITLGTHTIVCKEKLEEGTYTGTFVFNVSEDQGRFPVLSSGVAPRIHPYTTENGEVNYLLYVPDGYTADSKKKWPLLIYLHGRSRVYGDVLALEDDYPLNTLADDGSFPFIVVAPKSIGDYDQWASDTQVQMAITVLDEVQAKVSIDNDRAYLTGGSGGGNGVWVISTRYPDRFAALVPFMGYYGYPFTVPDNICDIKNVPVWAFHGDADEIIPIEAEQKIVDALIACGGDVRFTIFPGIGHDLDHSIIYNSDLYDWLLSHTRDTHQE